MRVDEDGTEAAAATSGLAERNSDLPDRIDLRFDRPFMFLVGDGSTAQILFLGHVAGP